MAGAWPAEEIYPLAQEHGFTWGAVRPADALLDDPHPADRGFWNEVPHPELSRGFVYPGEAAVFSRTPWRSSHRAPRLGEHNQEIYEGELGLSPKELALLVAEGAL